MAEVAYAAGPALLADLGAPRLLLEKTKQIKQTTKRQKVSIAMDSRPQVVVWILQFPPTTTLSSLLHRIAGKF